MRFLQAKLDQEPSTSDALMNISLAEIPIVEIEWDDVILLLRTMRDQLTNPIKR